MPLPALPPLPPTPASPDPIVTLAPLPPTPASPPPEAPRGAAEAGEPAEPALRAEGTTPDTPVDPTVTASSPPHYVFEVAGRSGYATTPIRGGVNPFGLGFGARLGFDIWHLYLGATVMDYLGDSDVGATDQALLFGLELGWNAHIGRYLTLRPQMGFGETILSHTEPLPPGAPGTVDVVTSASGSSGGGGASTVTFASGAFFAALHGGAIVLPGIIYGPAPAQDTTWVSYLVDAQLGFRL